MAKLSLTGLVAAVSGLALSLTAGAVTASADPDLGPVINTTCNYSQVVAALNAQDPAAAAQLSASPTARSLLRSFLASPPDERQQIVQELQSYPGGSAIRWTCPAGRQHLQQLLSRPFLGSGLQL
jgi:hemophore-related protein